MQHFKIFWMILGLIFVSMAHAENTFNWDGDVFLMGDRVAVAGQQYDDVFAVGEDISLRSQSTGDNVLMGNIIMLDAAIGGDLYALANGLTINEPVTGDASLVGNRLDINAPIAGDLRVAASAVSIKAPVTGSVLMVVEDFYLDGVLTGDVSLAVSTMSFGPHARIDGELTIYGDASEFNLPTGLIDEQRIKWLNMDDIVQPGLAAQNQPYLNQDTDSDQDVFSELIQIGLMIVVAMVLVTVMPQRTAQAMEYVQNQLWRSIGWGFMFWSFLFGAVVASALTLVGIVLIPVWLLLALLAGCLGYVMGCYLIGARINQLLSWPEPNHWLQRVKVAVMGVLLIVLLGLIPWLGWWLVLIVSCLGQGTMMRSSRA